MDILSKEVSDTTVVSLSGSLDGLTSPKVIDYLSRQIAGGERQIILDLSQVDFLSSAGLRVILTALKEVRREGGDLRLAGARSGVEKSLRMAGFTTILKAFSSIDEAVSSFAA
jgi:anti-anti-sigma factor